MRVPYGSQANLFPLLFFLRGNGGVPNLVTQAFHQALRIGAFLGSVSEIRPTKGTW